MGKTPTLSRTKFQPGPGGLTWITKSSNNKNPTPVDNGLAGLFDSDNSESDSD